MFFQPPNELFLMVKLSWQIFQEGFQKWQVDRNSTVQIYTVEPQ